MDIKDKLRLATINDFNFFFDIKSEESNIYWTGHREKPKEDNILNWFQQNLISQEKLILIYQVNNISVGYTYIDLQGEFFETSIAISEKYSGKGYGSRAIAKTVEYCKDISLNKAIFAWVREDNHASLKAHLNAGYQATDLAKKVSLPHGGLATLVRFIYRGR